MSSSGDITSTTDVSRTVYATDNSVYQIEPAQVAAPRSAADVEDLLRRNHAAGAPSPVVARGAGTGTNGQSLTDGILVDMKRFCHRVVSVDTERRTAVVEPGVVTAELNALLAPQGLHWAPHTSTLNRATVGGMISTDAAGKGSLVHGRAHRHVIALDVLLNDGTPWRAEAVSVAEAERRAAGTGRSATLWRSLLALKIDEHSELELPELARGFSGYGIDRFRRDGLIDPVALLVGAEGTLAIITAATLRLTPLPAHTRLVVASYPSFREALTDAVELRDTNPTAIETFDERTLQQGRSSPGWPALGAVVGDHDGSVLLLEYSGASEPDLDPVAEALSRTGRSIAWQTLTDPAIRADAWKVRADAVGLLAKLEVGAPERSARPTAFVEDCAVPVDAMVEFISAYRAVLDSFGVEYGMFGHADVGCVHVRPALDTTDPADEQLIRDITDRVVALVAEHGGVLWGEHGRGFRGESVETFLSPSTIGLMRQIKSAFDAEDLLNPGKLYRPADVDEPIRALDDVPLRGHANRTVPVEIRRQFASAFACNGNGLCHHYDAAEVMCPSYKATRDPALSPKGRSDLLREWLRRREDHSDAGFGDLLAENLDQCLSCSACTGRCPVEVDIPEMKSRFLADYYSSRRRPPAHIALSRFEQLAAQGARLAGPARLGAPLAGRLLGLVDLPVPERRRPSSIPPFDPASSHAALVLLPDVFTSVLEPDTLEQAGRVLSRLGYSVHQAPFLPSGKYDHVKGRRRAFARAARAQAELIESILSAGATPVAIEPATGLLHQHEYPTIHDGYPTGVRHVIDMIAERADRLAGPSGSRGPVTVLGHCTERATRPQALTTWRSVLETVGHEVATPNLGCCGMAGIFGHERANQSLSRSVWELSWARQFDTDGPLTATGYSCRSQTLRMVGVSLAHPLHLI